MTDRSSTAERLPDPNHPAYEAARQEIAAILHRIGEEDARNGYTEMGDDLLEGDLMQVPTWIALGMLVRHRTLSQADGRGEIERLRSALKGLLKGLGPDGYVLPAGAAATAYARQVLASTSSKEYAERLTELEAMVAIQRRTLRAIRDWQGEQNPAANTYRTPIGFNGSPFDYLRKLANDGLKEGARIAWGIDTPAISSLSALTEVHQEKNDEPA